MSKQYSHTATAMQDYSIDEHGLVRDNCVAEVEECEANRLAYLDFLRKYNDLEES